MNIDSASSLLRCGCPAARKGAVMFLIYASLTIATTASVTGGICWSRGQYPLIARLAILKPRGVITTFGYR